LGFEVRGLRFEVWGLGYRVWGSGCGGSRFRVFRFWGCSEGSWV